MTWNVFYPSFFFFNKEKTFAPRNNHRGSDSLRSSRFLFLQAKRGKRARALGKKEQKSRLFAQCPRALAPLGLKEKETTATQARDLTQAKFSLNNRHRAECLDIMNNS